VPEALPLTAMGSAVSVEQGLPEIATSGPWPHEQNEFPTHHILVAKPTGGAGGPSKGSKCLCTVCPFSPSNHPLNPHLAAADSWIRNCSVRPPHPHFKDHLKHDVVGRRAGSRRLCRTCVLARVAVVRFFSDLVSRRLPRWSVGSCV